MTKILVIEDELFVRENIVDLLEAEDFEVFSTENGILGILWAQENLPDLAICDVMMPVMSGYDVLREMRELPETELIPFIFLTAMADKSDVRRGMELGADDYLTKPFTRKELLNTIDSRLLKHAKLMKQFHQEHQKNKILELKVQELEKLQLKEELSLEYQRALLKINTAINLVKRIQSEAIEDMEDSLSDRHLQTIKDTCATEITLLKQLPDLDTKIRFQNEAVSLVLQH